MLAYDQTRLHVLGTEDDYTNAIDDLRTWPDAYRVPLPSASLTAEITGVTPSVKGTGITSLFTFDEIDGTTVKPGVWQTVWTGTHDLPYEAIPGSDIDGTGTPAAAPTRRPIVQRRTLYRRDDLTALLPPAQLQPQALTGESYQAALTPGLLSAIFGTLVPAATLTEGGYVQLPGETGWWTPSGRVFYSPGTATRRHRNWPTRSASSSCRAAPSTPSVPSAAPATMATYCCRSHDRSGRQHQQPRVTIIASCPRRRSRTRTATGSVSPATPSARSPPPR